jgi:polyisoprenoid-binding protein YceI
MKIVLSFLAFLIYSVGIAQTQWALDKSHTNIKFNITHMTIAEVEGEFRDFDAKIVSPGQSDFNGTKVEFTAKTASINTANERRDNHLRSDDFFNSETYPELKLTGELVKEGEKYFLVGEFTMRDVTKPVRFDVRYMGQIDTNRGKKSAFKITGEIDRFDYGLKWNNLTEAGGLVVSREVQIVCNVELNEVR